MPLRLALLPALMVVHPTAAQALKVKRMPSPRRHVAGFYSWYVSVAMSERHKDPAYLYALNHRGFLFSPELFQALKEDADAQAAAEGEIVGLDWDPFLNAQDPKPLIVGGRVTVEGDRTLVEMHEMRRDASPSGTPFVTVELAFKNGGWVFTNFRFKEGKDLMSCLKVLRESRQRSAHS